MGEPGQAPALLRGVVVVLLALRRAQRAGWGLDTSWGGFVCCIRDTRWRRRRYPLRTGTGRGERWTGEGSWGETAVVGQAASYMFGQPTANHGPPIIQSRPPDLHLLISDPNLDVLGTIPMRDLGTPERPSVVHRPMPRGFPCPIPGPSRPGIVRGPPLAAVITCETTPPARPSTLAARAAVTLLPARARNKEHGRAQNAVSGPMGGHASCAA